MQEKYYKLYIFLFIPYKEKTRSGLRLLLTYEKVTSVDKALKVLQPLDVKAQVEVEEK